MIISLLFACSIKSGVTMVKAEQAYQQYNTAENRQAVYEWTQAEAYLFKAREEYADSSFEDAEKLALESVLWMEKSAQKASSETEKTGDEQ